MSDRKYYGWEEERRRGWEFGWMERKKRVAMYTGIRNDDDIRVFKILFIYF